MRIKYEQLHATLAHHPHRHYWLYGDDPLFMLEASCAIREQAKKRGYQRCVLTVKTADDWKHVLLEARTGSLFADKRLLEIQWSLSRLDKTSAQHIMQLSEQSSETTQLFIISDKLTPAMQKHAALKHFERTGTLVSVWPLPTHHFESWLQQRLAAAGFQVSDETVAWLSSQTMSNTIAAAQHIEKLRLQYPEARTLSLAQLKSSVTDEAEYSVYDLMSALHGDDPCLTLRIFDNLRDNGTEPTLVLWSLSRELRDLSQIAAYYPQSLSWQAVTQRIKIWPQRHAGLKRSVGRLPKTHWDALLAQVTIIDRLIKGLQPGNAWHAMEKLMHGMSGTMPITTVTAY